MKSKSRIVVTVALSLVLVLGLAASGFSMELWHYWLSGGEKEALDALMLEARSQYPEHTFREHGIPGSGSEIRQQIGSALMAGEPPEIFQSALGHSLKVYVDAGHLLPLDDVWAEIDGDTIFPTTLKNMVTFDGHPYGIPVNMHVINNVFYNKHVFDELGLEIPQNWDEFNELCVVLRENGVEPLAAAGGWATYPFYAPLVSVLGPEGYMELGEGKVSFTDPRMYSVFELYKETILSANMPGWAGYGWTEAANPFMQGDVAMYLNGDWLVALLEQRGWVPGEDFDFFPAPGMDNVVIIEVDAFAAFKDAADIDGAKAFMKATASTGGQAAYNSIKGAVAANLEVPASVYNSVLQRTHDRIEDLNVDGYVLPNLYNSMLPDELGQELKRQVERFALSPDDRTLESVLTTLENLRVRMLNQDKFIEWSGL